MAMKSMVYRLNDPGFTIYHRAALGGLAATIRAWNRHGVPEPLKYAPPSTSEPAMLTGADGSLVEISMDSAQVSLAWDEKTSHREILALLLNASFERTDQGMIFLPGQGFGPDREDVLIAVHNGLSQTFLQHNKKRPGSGVREVALVDEASGSLELLSYKKIDRYSHQFGQGTGLLGDAGASRCQAWFLVFPIGTLNLGTLCIGRRRGGFAVSSLVSGFSHWDS